MPVSVVMNSYREKPEYFRTAVESYLGQAGVDVELIVSTVKDDPCIELAKEYPIKLVISREPSIYRQLNAGMRMVTGEWVCYASSNDQALENKLASELDYCLMHRKLVCYSAFYRCDDLLRIESVVRMHDYDFSKHLERNFVSDCSLFASHLIDTYGPFREKWANSAYHDFWLRVYEGEGNVFVYNENPTWKYRVSKDSRHWRKKRDQAWFEREMQTRRAMIRTHQK